MKAEHATPRASHLTDDVGEQLVTAFPVNLPLEEFPAFMERLAVCVNFCKGLSNHELRGLNLLELVGYCGVKMPPAPKKCFYCKVEFPEREDGPPFCDKHLEEHSSLLQRMGLTPDYLLPQEDRYRGLPFQTGMTNLPLTQMIMKYSGTKIGVARLKQHLLEMDAFYEEHLPLVTQVRALFHLKTEPHFFLNKWNMDSPDCQVFPEGSTPATGENPGAVGT